MNRTLNTNEKIARNVVGIETDAKHFVVNGKSADELWEAEARNKYNQKVDEYVERLDNYNKDLEENSKKINIEGLEIKAIGCNMIVYPFAENPFQRIKTTESGIIVDLGGLKPQYKSNETGETEEEEQFIHVGTVFDAGPDCKYIKDGDIVMWTKPSETPIPFYRQNMVLINETRVLCVINEKLEERFNK